jgi:CRP-like cAMP-binding protein
MNNFIPAEDNLILASLDAGDMRMLEPDLRDMVLKLDTVLAEPGAPIEYVYFPTHGMVSIVSIMRGGQAVETGLVGREGIAGSSVIGRKTSEHQLLVQAPGGARRLPSQKFVAAYEHSRTLRGAVNRQIATLWGMAQQSAACNALHTLEARLARWLLQSRDRLGSDELPLKQEFLAIMLGVQRTSITLAERNLQEQEIIRIGRARVTILDAAALGKRACECYATLKAQEQGA